MHEEEALLVEERRWEPLIELYLAQLAQDAPDQTRDRAALLRKIARVFERHLDDADQALDAIVGALSEDLYDGETARELERLAHITSRWGEVIETVSGWITPRTSSADRVRLCLYLAKWYGDDLGRPEYAQPYYAQITQLDANNVEAMRQLACLYRNAGNWSQMGTTLHCALEAATTDVERKEIMTGLGELLDLQMHETDKALAYFKQAILVDPAFVPALEHLDRIYAARGLSAELAVVLVQKARALTDRAEVAIAKLRAAELHETSLGDPAHAARIYREVLEADPASLPALRGLARTYEALREWSQLVRVLEAQLDVAVTERERIDILMVLATVQDEHFLKADVAAERLEQVLEIDPDDEEAFAALERNLERRHQWRALIAIYERHIAQAVKREAKVALFRAIARVYEIEIGDAACAIAAYEQVVGLDAHDLPALDALAKLSDKAGNAAQSVAYMTRVAQLTLEPKAHAEALFRIGQATGGRLGDACAAERRYEQVLDLDPTHVGALAALRAIAIAKSDFAKAARWLDLEQSYTSAPRHRARLLGELGALRQEKLGDHASAVLTWEAALEADPNNESAALPLSDEYFARGEWAKAEPLFDLLVQKSKQKGRHEQHALYDKLGRVCAGLGKNDKALKAFTAAHQLDLGDASTAYALADVCFRLEDWTGALAAFQKILTHMGEHDVETRAKIYGKLGAIKRELGQSKQAIAFYEKALGVDGAYRPTLDALAALYAEMRDWKNVVAYKRQILDGVADPDARLALLDQIAEVWLRQEKNPVKAAAALEEAREIAPRDASLIHRLIALYQAIECWPKLRGVLRAAADLERDPGRRSKFLYTMAQIHRDKEDEPEEAAALFDQALDADPTHLEAFERINKIFTARRDWKALERAFRKMLRRLSAAGVDDPSLEYNLWHSLGLIYRDRLQDTPSAIEAFKMAARFKPEDVSERKILAELYALASDPEGAIGEHSIILQREPLSPGAYRSLSEIYAARDDYDRAWCMCAALSFLGEAATDERSYFEEHRPRGIIEPRSRLDNEQWVRNVFHKDENLFVGKIMEMITPAAIIAKAEQGRGAKALAQQRLERGTRQDTATSTDTFASIFGWAAQVLGLPTPELYVRSDVPGALVAVPSMPPASVAGKSLLEGFTAPELAFVVGKHLSRYRGEHYIRNLFPTLSELKVLFFAAVQLVTPGFAVPEALAPAVAKAARTLTKHMQPIALDGLRLVVQKFVADGARADLKRWMQTTELTACRAGLLLCADLDVARSILAAEPQLPGDLAPQEKMKELLLFSVSEQYFALRSALRIAIGQR